MKRFYRALPIALIATLFTAGTALAQAGDDSRLQVITPSENQTIYGSRVPILFSVQSFTLVENQTTNRPQTNQGHILLWLDDKDTTPNTATIVAADSFTYSDVSYGDHTLIAELVTTDNKTPNPPPKHTTKF